MTTNEIDVYRSANIDARIRYATLIADARGLLPDGVHSPAHALLIFEQAAALGIPPITGLSQIHIIKGKPTLSAGVMSGLIRQAGHKLRVWVEGKVEDKSLVAKAELVRSDDPDFTFKVEFSLKDAERAGLYPGKSDSNWSKWPRSMVKARATSEIAREGATDVFLGSVYTPEELDPNVEVDEQGEMVAAVVPSDSAGRPQAKNVSSETTESSEIPEGNPDGMPDEVRAQWFDLADRTKSYDGLITLYKDAKSRGLLHITHPEDESAALGEYITALGKAAKLREEQGVGVNEETGEVVDEGPAAVLDDVIDAEIVEDEPQEPAEEPKKAPAARRTRKPANASDAPAQQG